MKKIVCFTDSLGSGGAQRQLVGLVKLLTERGYDVSVLVYWNIMFYKPELDAQNIDVHLVGNDSNPILRLWRLFRFFQKNRCDVVIAYQETPSMIACLFRPLLNWSKLIVSERNTTQQITWREKVRFWLYRFADYIVPNSYSQAEFISSRYPNLKDKIVPITNFVDTEHFKPSIADNSAKRAGNTVVVVGSNKLQKNFHRFIDAVKILVDSGTDLHVKWYGILSNDLGNYRGYVEALGLIDVVDVYEPVINVKEVYQSADFFCLPSLFEGFPNVLCEAISAGLPVACSNVCDNPYIINQIEGGVMFNPYDVEDIADKLKQLLATPNAEMKQYCANNRIVAEQLFSKESFVAKYSELL